MIEAVIFDVDGTLVDTVEQHAKAWLWVFARHGHDIPLDEIRKQIGKGGDQLMPVLPRSRPRSIASARRWKTSASRSSETSTCPTSGPSPTFAS